MPRRLVLLLAGVLRLPGVSSAQEEPWLEMDYGPFVSTAVGLGEGVPPVHKGLVVELRTPAGERTDLRAVFDTDLLAWRCVWRGELTLRGIVYDGPHGVFPEIRGEPVFRTGALPGIVASGSQSMTDPRQEPWGPVPPALGRWTGLYLDGDDVVLEYTAANGAQRIRERVWAQAHVGGHAFVREINVESPDRTRPGPTLLLLGPGSHARVNVTGAGTVAEDGATLTALASGTIRVAVTGAGEAAPVAAPPATTVEEVIARARPRWGEPLLTRGVVGVQLGAGPIRRRITQRPGDPAREVELAAAGGGGLELLDRRGPVESGPATSTLVLRTIPGGPSAFPDNETRIGWWPADTGSGSHERNAFTGVDDLRLAGVTWRRGVVGRALDFDGTAAAWLDRAELDLREHDLTVAAWIHTTNDGTVFALAPRSGEWARNGMSLFLREGLLTLDVGWVGAVSGGPRIDDGTWHHVAATRGHDTGGVRLFVDGAPVAGGSLPLRGDDTAGFVGRFGWTSDDFPRTSRFSGYMDGLLLLRKSLTADGIVGIAELTGEALTEATIVRSDAEGAVTRLVGAGADRSVRLSIPASRTEVSYRVIRRRGPRSVVLAWGSEASPAGEPAEEPFRIDRITWPEDNPFGSWLRFGALELLPAAEGRSTAALITTWSGDLWRVDGLDEELDELRWTRVATGLSQPFGIARRGDEVLVLGRDQITRLHDRNGDGEADFYENLNNANRNSEHFHEPASGLQVAPDGSLLYIKAARHAKHALHDHHGAVLQISPDGIVTEVVARGFRAPIGLTRLPDGSLLASDQEGHWTPANRINLIRPSAEQPRFYGNGWAARPEPGERIGRDGELVQAAWEPDARIEPPLTWLHPSVDRSPSSQLLVDHPAWGPLQGSYLGLSYGTGEVYLILRDDVQTPDGSVVTQGGIVKLGIQFPTGLLSGRIHPTTGDLYVCGLFGWSSDRTEPGGFYRIRPRTEAWAASLNVPHRVRALPDGLELTFLEPLDPAAATAVTSWSATAWNYRRSSEYGSATHGLDGTPGSRTRWAIRRATLSPDGRSVRLQIDGFEPAMQVHVTWSVRDAEGRPIVHEAHLTVHATHGGDR